MNNRPETTGAAVQAIDTRSSISVVILNKDEPELDETLERLRPQCAELGAECLVVDASEGRLDWIRQKHTWAGWIDYRMPFGLASSIPQQRNVGVHAATGDIIAFCDAGGDPDPHWLRTLVEPILAGQQTVTCGPVRSTRPGVYKVINDLPDGHVVERVLTANLAFTRAAFEKVDGFDERYAYGSDMDFAWRLTNAGENPTSVQGAVMGMDWGAWSLQKKRSWRYGRARGRLLRFHPDRRGRILLGGPEVIVYPVMFAGGLLGAALLVTGTWWPIAGWTAAASVLRLRQRNEERPWAVMLSHSIYSTATIVELLAATKNRLVGRVESVGHTPKDPGPYQDHLIRGLEEAGVHSDYIVGPTGSATLNTFLLPVRAIGGRLRGRRIHHIHWAHEYSLVWTKTPATRRLMRLLFATHLWVLKRCGTKVVWTAHNLLPHETIFDDEVRARKTLVRYADAVIAHNEHSKQEIEARFGARDVHVIPQGATPLPAVENGRRNPSGVLSLAVVGRINHYKGVEEVLEAVALAARDGVSIHLTVAGEPVDAGLGTTIEQLAATARDAGATVELMLRRVSDQELAEVLAGADYAVYAFRAITNSGSVTLALSNNRPALVRDLPALSDLPDDCVERWSGGATELAAKLHELADEDPQQRGRKTEAAKAWAEERTWKKVGEATRRVYEEITKRRRSR
jgi:glycosyltransferase involved in cell wall biosynthesis